MAVPCLWPQEGIYRMSTRKLGPCVRCFDPHPAEIVVHVMAGSEVYALALCESQARRFQDNQMQWARYGTPVVMPDPHRRVEVPVVPAARTPRPVQLGLPLKYNRWTFTEHARTRQAERGLTDSEILWCAENPDIKMPGKTSDIMVYKRGKVHIVVKPTEFEIVTVVDRTKVSEYASA